MLSNFFKPAWQNTSVKKRLSAVANLHGDNAEHQKILLQLASNDNDNTIRIEAIRRLNDAVVLHELSKNSLNSSLKNEAENRLNELMATGQMLDEAQFQNLLTDYPELHQRIAIHADLGSIRTLAIQNLPNNELLKVISVTRHNHCRQIIVDKLLDIESLESARKIMRGKDKTAERTIKSKIDAIKCQTRELLENKSQVTKLIEEIEYLAAHDWLPEFQSRCRSHQQQWGNLAFKVENDDQERYQLAFTLVDAHYQHQLETERAQNSQRQLLDELEVLLKFAADRSIAALVEASLEIQLQLQQLGTHWQALAKITKASESATKQYDKILLAIQSAIQFVTSTAEPLDVAQNDVSKQANAILTLGIALKSLKWPADLTELKSATEVQQQLSDWRNEQIAFAQAQREKTAQIQKNISTILRFSRAGNLARAKQVAQKVQKALNKFDGKDLIALQERFGEASKTLGDMDDWKNFATEPKYIELCDAMELLATVAGKSGDKQAEKRSNEMKALQQQWKSLGHSDISDQYWPRFKAAADQVYQLCAELFKKRHEERQVLLNQRGVYLEEMRQLLDSTNWDNEPDYKTIQASVHRINSGFSSVKGVERNAGEKQWKLYSTLKAAVMVKLDAAYNDNIALKHRLINQAQTLAEGAAIIDNLTHLKLLQTQWKQVGVIRRGDDQKAWKAFKQHSDIIYNKVQALRQAQRNETDQQLDAYRDIIKAITQLATVVIDLAEADSQFSALQARYSELPELPRLLPEKLLEGIQRDYFNACNQFDKGRSRIKKGKHNQQLDVLRQKARLCTQLESMATSPLPSEQQLQEIDQQWDSLELHSSALLHRIEARRKSAQSDIDRDAITLQRRTLCIQLEILMSIESPAEDSAIRMQYQLQQMNQSGLSQSVTNDKSLIADMELDWLCMPGANVEQQAALDDRFQRLLGIKRHQ